MTDSIYGPNTAEVEAMIEKIRTITPKQAEKLFATWDAIEAADRALAEFEALDATNSEQWIAVRYAAMKAMPDDVPLNVWEAIWGATLALVVRERMSKSDFDLLYGPWASVMEVSIQ